MSLATASAGGGMGGGAGLSVAAMAHGGPNAATLHQSSGPPPGAHALPPGMGGVAAPGNLSALAADLVDKGQQLSAKSVRNVSSLPIVAVDLYGEGGEVAYFPPAKNYEDDEEDDGDNPAETDDGPYEVRPMGTIGPTGTDLAIKVDDDASHRAVRKLLANSTGYGKVFRDALSDDVKGPGVAVVSRPHLLLGARRTFEVHPSALGRYSVTEDDGPAISEDVAARAVGGTSVTVRNSTLDGSAPKGDDFDRLAFNLAVHAKKKSLTMMPDEAVGVLIAKSKNLVCRSWAKGGGGGGGGADDMDPDDEECYGELPSAVALPGWACRDGAAESLLEAMGPNATVYQRSVAAAVGAFLPGSKGAPSTALRHVGKRYNEVKKERQLRAQRNEEGPTGEYRPTLIMAGMTSDGLELTALQVGHVQNPDEVDGMAPFGDVNVVSSVCHQTDDPLSMLKKGMKRLVEEVDEDLRELFEEDGGPAAIITYGTIAHQMKLKEKTDEILRSYEKKGVSGWNANIPHLSTHEECVACGTALLSAISHGRVFTVETVQAKGSNKKKHKGRAGIVVKDASCCAVGIQYNYFGGDADKWLPVKTIFDFGRRVPAGPYEVEINAAEAAALRAAGGELEEEKLLEEAKKLSGAKGIPKREEAALALRMRVVQRTERGGEWIGVGNPMMPLTYLKKDEDEDEDDSKTKEKQACESSVLELSLNPVGILTTSLISDGQSVVQATKSARKSAIQYYLGIFAAIAFFGGFLVKSYVEERVFERDTQRLLAYYKHAMPGSINDGDERNARYLVWKYKGKKDKLWRRLEAKYGVPVKQLHEWDDDDDAVEEEVEEQDLDEEEKKEEEETGEQDL